MVNEDEEEFASVLYRELKKQSETLENNLIELDNDPNNVVFLDEINICLHGLKGTFGLLGEHYSDLRIVFHQLEDEIKKDNTISSKTNSILLEISEDLRKLSNRVKRNNSTEVDFQDLFINSKAFITSDLILDQRFRIEVFFSANSAMPSARMMMLINKLKRISTIIETNPTDEELLESISFDKAIIIINTRESRHKISDAISRIPEIERFTITEKELESKKPSSSTASKISETVEVSINKLDEVISKIEELILAGNIIGKADLSQFTSDEIEVLSNFNNKIVTIQDLVFDIRLIPVNVIVKPLIRLIYQSAKDLNKKVRVFTSGEYTGIDRHIVEFLADPITVLVQNAILHGIEKPVERKELGKSETGKITIQVNQEDGEIRISISDDGKGIDYDKMWEKATKRKIINEQEFNKKQAEELLFRKGFSMTENAITQGGRGVGLFSVRRALEEIGAYIRVTSTIGTGSTFTIHIPVKKPIISIILCKIGNLDVGFPQSQVESIQRVNQSDLQELVATKMLRKNEFRIKSSTGESKTIVNLTTKLLQNHSSGMIDTPMYSHSQEQKINYTLINWKYKDEIFGFLVNEVSGIQDLAINYEDPIVDNIPFLSGTSMLGAESIVLILNPTIFLET